MTVVVGESETVAVSESEASQMTLALTESDPVEVSEMLTLYVVPPLTIE